MLNHTHERVITDILTECESPAAVFDHCEATDSYEISEIIDRLT